MSGAGRVGPAARVLGFAGLLPQAAFVVSIPLLEGVHGPALTVIAAAVYPLAILSFLGGTWWGLAMRSDVGQGTVASLAVVPSLVAVVLTLAGMVTIDSGGFGWTLAAIGSAVILTLPGDRWLAARGLAPEGWMALRLPLSIGLGGLTIAAGALAGF